MILKRSVPLAFVCPWRFSLVFDFGWGFLGDSAIAVDIGKGRSNTWPICRLFGLISGAKIPLTQIVEYTVVLLMLIKYALPFIGLVCYGVFSM